jgi:hypothetical protein
MGRSRDIKGEPWLKPTDSRYDPSPGIAAGPVMNSFYEHHRDSIRWHYRCFDRAPPHLPRHLLFRILAYRLQADRLGELDSACRRLLDRIGSGSPGRDQPAGGGLRPAPNGVEARHAVDA